MRRRASAGAAGVGSDRKRYKVRSDGCCRATDEPPGVNSELSGCRVGPKSNDVVTPLQANSDVAPMPTTTAPAFFNRSTATASRGAMKCEKAVILA